MANTTKEVEFDERFKFGPAPIQTAEDAVMAYLREEITEEEFRQACGKFGVLPGTLFNNLPSNSPARVDAAFRTQIPDDIFLTTPAPEVSLERKLAEVNAKEDLREAALKATEKKRSEQNQVVSVPFVGNNLSDEEAHDLEEKILVPKLAANPDNKIGLKETTSSHTVPAHNLNTKGKAEVPASTVETKTEVRPATASEKKSVAKKTVAKKSAASKK
jgi:hypothetical protein